MPLCPRAMWMAGGMGQAAICRGCGGVWVDLGLQGAMGAQLQCAHAPVCGRWEGVGG